MTHSGAAVSVTFSSDMETSVCRGAISDTPAGRLLVFDIGSNEYSLLLAEGGVEFCARGELEYTLVLGDERTQTDIRSPYGSLHFDVVTKAIECAETPDGLRLRLVYELVCDREVILRDITLTVVPVTEIP